MYNPQSDRQDMRRKISLLITALIIGALQAHAQLTPQYTFNALQFSSQYYDGTARSLAMGNAMTALGGDMGALSYNPAASGVYRYSEFTLTPSLYSGITSTSFLGSSFKDSRTRFALSNVGWTGSFDTGRTRGLLNINLAVTANQTNNFAFRSSGSGVQNGSSYLGSLAASIPQGVTGYDLDMYNDYDDYPFYNSGASWTHVLAWNAGLLDTLSTDPTFFLGATENIGKDGQGNPVISIPGTLNQSFRREKTGYVQDVVINASGNIDNIFFFGISLTLQSIWASEYTSISETAANSALFQTGFSGFTRKYTLTTSGMGVDVSAGFIVRPVAGLTIGGSISTPNWMFLNESWQESVSAETGTFGTARINSPTGSYSYRLTAPFKWNLGIGYTLGSLMAIGVDYERTDYSDIRLASSGGDQSAFAADNEYMAAYYQAVNNVRAGLEVWPHKQLAVRLGYNWYSSSEREFDNSRHYASAGIGFRTAGGFFIDAAYQQLCNTVDNLYSLYDSYAEGSPAPLVKEKGRNWKVLLTLGWRF